MDRPENSSVTDREQRQGPADGMLRFSRRTMMALSAVLAGTASVVPARAADADLPVADDGTVHLPARTIDPPNSISEAARAYLRKGASTPALDWPPSDDKEGWRKAVAEHDGATLRFAGGGEITLPGFAVETKTMGGVTVYVVTAAGTTPQTDKPQYTIHGGGWTSGSGKMARLLAQVQAMKFGGTVYEIDYRTPPDYPFPAPLEDCLAVYRELLKQYPPERILVTGGSAGANLAAALMLKARDVGLPKPGALILQNAVTDLTCSSDSLRTNEYIDTALKVWKKDANIAVYANGADVNNPYLSPLKGDLARGFPPTYLQTGTRDLMLSDTVRFHAALRKAGVGADLYVGEAMTHGGFGMRTPEDEDARQDTLRWLAKHWI